MKSNSLSRLTISRFMALSAFLGFFPAAALAEYDLFMKIDGIPGESTSETHPGEIEVLSWQWGLSQTVIRSIGPGNTAGKVNYEEIQITKYIDRASPLLMAAVSEGKHIKQAVLYAMKEGRSPDESKVITMNDVLVTSTQLGGAAGGDRLTETITMQFNRVKVDYQPTDPKGNPLDPFISFVWDLLKNSGFVTGVPAPTPTETPVEVPTPTPLPGDAGPVLVFDNPMDPPAGLGQPINGQMDFDSPGGRNLTLVCTASTQGAKDWHVYVRKGFGGMKFLGRTGSGGHPVLNWSPGGSSILSPEFANGPDFNAIYTFRMVRIDDTPGPDDYYDMTGITGYNIEGGNSLPLSFPEMPYLSEREVAVSDDILGLDTIAPAGSTGSDTDAPESRALQIAWNFDADPAEVFDYHVYISVNGGKFEYLGQTFSGKINYYWWTPNQEFKINPAYAAGPQNGNIYQFRVYLLPFAGDSQTMDSGKVMYSVD
ncbi:MAG: Hcp family type VI secretion system effector [bacterium]